MKHRGRIVAAVLAITLAALTPTVDDHLQAISVMMHVMDPQTKSRIARYRQQPVRDQTFSLPNGTRARRYTPQQIRSKHAIVVVHGVHHLGIEEPRLIAFSRSLAGEGIEVLTPELPGIADFRVTPDSITAIGEAAKEMRRLSGQPVGIFGLSFSGGLALIAAADDRFRDDVAFVIAVGAHHDMGRVARFFATNEAPRPDGSVLRMQAHGYGALVLAYDHPEDFFPAGEIAAAQSCLKEVLYETTCDSSRLPLKTREEMQHVFSYDTAYFRERILASAARHEAEYAQVSPRGKLGGLKAEVMLLHGAGDDVIPPSETEWLAQEVPPKLLNHVLISPAISHVEIGSKPNYLDQFRVVQFIAEMISEAED